MHPVLNVDNTGAGAKLAIYEAQTEKMKPGIVQSIRTI
jgi:hypothetical protein